MSKEELIHELTDIDSSFITDINTKLSNLDKKFNDFQSKYDNVNSELQQCKKSNSYLLTRIIQLECNAVTNSQYSRRETKELNPVLADIIEDFFFFFNWDSPDARLNSHYEAWSYNKKKKAQKILQDTENMFTKNLQLKDVC